MSSFPFKEQAFFNFMATVTIQSDSGAQENKVCHCFHFIPFYLPWSDGTYFEMELLGYGLDVHLSL